MPLDGVAAGYTDIHMAKLGKAINDDGKYHLVWNLVSYSQDAESDAKIKTIHVLDAGTGEPLADPITKEGGSWGAGTEKIELFGTHVIPEFGAIAALILTVAIASIIAASAKFQLGLAPKY